MIYSKPFSTFSDKFVKPSNHEGVLWAILILKKMKGKLHLKMRVNKAPFFPRCPSAFF